MDKANGATLNEQTKTIELATDTLRGDVRDVVLEEFKAVAKPWQAMNEEEQDRVIRRASDLAETIVRRSVDIVAARGLPALAITVGKFTVDGAGIKGTFECYADDESLLRIRHLAEKRAMFVLASPDAYSGEQAPAETSNVGDLAIPKDAMAEENAANLEKLGKTMTKKNREAAAAAPPVPEADREVRSISPA